MRNFAILNHTWEILKTAAGSLAAARAKFPGKVAVHFLTREHLPGPGRVRQPV